MELEWPKASLDLASPGPLEAILFDTLGRRIGVGLFPNEDLQVVDTAANLINFATFARAGQRLVKPSDTIQRLRLRTDYGRIAQQFPINTSLLVQRSSVEDAVQELLRHANSLVTMNLYAQAVTQAKRQAQSRLVSMLLDENSTTQSTALIGTKRTYEKII